MSLLPIVSRQEGPQYCCLMFWPSYIAIYSTLLHIVVSVSLSFFLFITRAYKHSRARACTRKSLIAHKSIGAWRSIKLTIFHFIPTDERGSVHSVRRAVYGKKEAVDVCIEWNLRTKGLFRWKLQTQTRLWSLLYCSVYKSLRSWEINTRCTLMSEMQFQNKIQWNLLGYLGLRERLHG